MPLYRILCAALLFTLCIDAAGAQTTAPAFPIIPPVDSVSLESARGLHARLHAASLAVAWLERTRHPAKDSIDFPRGLIASLANALLRIEATTNIPELDSAVRWLAIEPWEWKCTTDLMKLDAKPPRWVKAFNDGKRKTGNREIDALIRKYGLRAVSRQGYEGYEGTMTCATDSIVNTRSLTAKLVTIKGLKRIDLMAFAGVLQSDVEVVTRDDRWRFIYSYEGDRGRFRWAFDVLTDGSVVHTRLRQ